MSPRTIMPRSPWIASAGWRKNDGVPVDASVALIFLQMIPDLPRPIVITRPAERVDQLHDLDECVVEMIDEPEDRRRLDLEHALRLGDRRMVADARGDCPFAALRHEGQIITSLGVPPHSKRSE